MSNTQVCMFTNVLLFWSIIADTALVLMFVNQIVNLKTAGDVDV